MKIFISWSGERSRKVAELVDDWLRCVIQASKPWMSSRDIDRGSIWFSEVFDQLSQTGIGIVCLTKENREAPWILFESGALAKGLEVNRVCTLLIDLDPTDVKNPLAQFNHTSFNKAGLWNLTRTINKELKAQSMDEQILEKVFETYWPKFEKDFKSILKSTKISEDSKAPSRTDEDILREILTSVRGMDRRIRALEDPDLFKPHNYILSSSFYDLDKEIQELKKKESTIDKFKLFNKYVSKGYPISAVQKAITDSLDSKESDE